MPDPISSSNRSAYETCDPANASCVDSPPAPPPTASKPPIVTIEPVVITGDAGAQELLRRHDSQTCAAQKQSSYVSCSGIALGMLNAFEGGPITGFASAVHASVGCGKDLRAVHDCEQFEKDFTASLTEAIDDCHEREGVVKPGSSQNEIICEVTP